MIKSEIKPYDLCLITLNTIITKYETWVAYMDSSINFSNSKPVLNFSHCIMLEYNKKDNIFYVFLPAFGLCYLSGRFHTLVKIS